MSEETTDEIEKIEPQDDVDDAGSRRNLLIIGAIAAACLLLVLGYFYYGRGKTADAKAAAGGEEAKPDVVVSVKVAAAERDSIAQEFTAIGTVAPAEQSTVAASISAQIRQMRLLKNQFVRQGEVVAVLASQDLDSQRREAQATLQEAELNLQTLQKVTVPQTQAQNQKDSADAKAVYDNARALYERRKDLYGKGGIALKDLEATELTLKNAENALRLAEQNARLNKTAVNPNQQAIAQNKIKQAQEKINSINTQSNLAQVRAPLSGVVTDQFQFEGEYAAAGAKLLTIAATNSVIVKANFSDAVAASLQPGDAVTIRLPSRPDEQMGGKVTLISHVADPTNRTVEVWANFANARGALRPGDAVQFVVSSKPAADAVIVPAAAVTLDAANSDEGTVMTVDKSNVARETKVKIGIKQADKIQITEGLTGGETVVIEGNYSLPDGSKVEIAKDEEKTGEEK